MQPTNVFAGTRKSTYSIRKASDLMGGYGVCFAIYGPPGAGKTTLAAQAADSEFGGKVCIIDCEGGARAVGDRHDIDVIPVQDSDTTHENGMGFQIVENILDDLVARKLPYGTVIVDNMSELNAMCVSHVIRTVPRNVDRRDLPDQKTWNTTTSAMLLLVRRFRDFAQASGTNVIFVAWDRAQDDRVTGVSKKDLGLNPALANQFPGLIDIVGYLTIAGKSRRTLSFEASASSAAKFRRSATEAAMTVPGELSYDFGSPNKPLKDLLDCLKGNVPFPAAKYTRAASGGSGGNSAAASNSRTVVAGEARGV